MLCYVMFTFCIPIMNLLILKLSFYDLHGTPKCFVMNLSRVGSFLSPNFIFSILEFNYISTIVVVILGICALFGNYLIFRTNQCRLLQLTKFAVWFPNLNVLLLQRICAQSIQKLRVSPQQSDAVWFSI